MMRRLVMRHEGALPLVDRRAHLARDHHHLHRHAGAVRRRRRARGRRARHARPGPLLFRLLRAGRGGRDERGRRSPRSRDREATSRWWRPTHRGRWWGALAGARAPKVFAKLPFIEIPTRPADLPAYVIGPPLSDSHMLPTSASSRSPTTPVCRRRSPRFGGLIAGAGGRRRSWSSCRSPSRLTISTRRSARPLSECARGRRLLPAHPLPRRARRVSGRARRPRMSDRKTAAAPRRARHLRLCAGRRPEQRGAGLQALVERDAARPEPARDRGLSRQRRPAARLSGGLGAHPARGDRRGLRAQPGPHRLRQRLRRAADADRADLSLARRRGDLLASTASSSTGSPSSPPAARRSSRRRRRRRPTSTRSSRASRRGRGSSISPIRTTRPAPISPTTR